MHVHAIGVGVEKLAQFLTHIFLNIRENGRFNYFPIWLRLELPLIVEASVSGILRAVLSSEP